MKVLLASSSAIALPTAQALETRGWLKAVLTSPPAPAGRGKILTPNPIEEFAHQHNIPALKPERLGSEARAQVEELHCDVLVSFSYGRIFGPKFLAVFPLGGVNLHPSLLPRHRGPAPAVATILSGDPEAGLTLQTLALEVDSGDILLQTRWPLDGRETAADILERSSREAPKILLDALENWQRVWEERRPQNHEEATWSRLLEKSEGLLVWSQDAEGLDRRIRACIPWPGAYTFLGGRRLLIWEAIPDPQAPTRDVPGKVLGLDKASGIRVQTGKGHLLIRSLQWEGKKKLDYLSFWNGLRDVSTTILG